MSCHCPTVFNSKCPAPIGVWRFLVEDGTGGANTMFWEGSSNDYNNGGGACPNQSLQLILITYFMGLITF